MKFKPYPKYKPSGIEWLGEIPAHWEVKRLKYISTINDEALPETTPLDFEFSYLDIGGVDPDKEKATKETMIFEKAPSRARRIVRPGDTIVSTVRTYLRAIKAITEEDVGLIVSTGFAVVRPKGINANYLAFALKEKGFVDQVVGRSVGVSYPAINASEIGTIEIPIPPLKDQIEISSFLSEKLNKLDHLVEQKQRLIDRLKEKRSALISHAVTKGLPPQAARAAGLPVNPKMKPSGVDWLGDVPAHWEIKPLKRIGKAILGLTYSPEDVVGNETEGILVFRASNLQSGQIVYDDNVYVDTEVPTEIKTIVGDILLCSRSGSQDLIGKNAIVSQKDAEKTFGAFMTVFRSKLNNYVYYVLNSTLFERQKGQYQTTTINQLTSETLNGFKIPIPPTKERQEIVALLKNETQRIDNLTTKVVMVIERLSESRSALIQAAVSGKINVQGA